DEAFLQLSEYLERDQETARGVKTALRYPSFVLLALVIAMAVVNTMVIPKFADMFSKFGAELPLPTQILIGISDFFVVFWPYLLVLSVGGFLWARRYLASEQGALNWGQRKLKLPVVGDIINRATLSRYARTFAMMLRSGVPLPKALELSARALENPYLAVKVRDIRASIERGDNL
ncbi:MAG: type II secretion system F family protein, partial [Porticoccaceae bacterium]|nr:type II secretion system F family protein [Porticoccaceae bacterium]